MRFSIYLPPAAATRRLPVLYWLSGLSCTEENFMAKAGAERLAAEHGIILVAPDTSPRSTGIAGEADRWDLGAGAGFYVDATREPWARHYRMYEYVTRELPELVAAEFPVLAGHEGIFGHSMGGHGALVCALRQPGRYRSVSAFAPICAPSDCPWGRAAFTAYLGEDRAAWAEYDACALIARGAVAPPLWVDQGLDDPFRAEQLLPERLREACARSGQPLELREHAGYDHSYYFVASFMRDHFAHHARALCD